MVNNEVKKVLK